MECTMPEWPVRRAMGVVGKVGGMAVVGEGEGGSCEQGL
jgi:hypothetical protein